MKVVAVVPCFNSSKIAKNVVKELLDFVDFVVCVDDFCPENTGLNIEKSIQSERLQVIYHSKNMGVGGATKTGIKYAISIEAEIIVKIDSDGQMNPKDIHPRAPY